MKITNLISLLLLLLLNACAIMEIRAGARLKESVNYEHFRHKIGWYDGIILNNGEELYFKKPIGICGGGVALLFIVYIPIPAVFSGNSCEQEFIIQMIIPDKNDKQIKLRYNNKTHEAIDISKISEFVTTIKFKVNMKELLDSEDKAIIIETKNLTQELPFEWGPMIVSTWSSYYGNVSQ